MMLKLHDRIDAVGFKTLPKAAVLLACIVLLSGCSSDNMDDLRAYVQSVKARPASRIPPLPTFETYVNFPYSAAHLRDPFAPFVPEGAVAQQQPGAIKPPITHRREPLEEFPLDSLKFVGLLERAGERWAIISAPDGLIHRVNVGNYIGQNYGKITSISESKIELMETVSNGLGGWVERPAALSVVE
jgi:type IV pilus assembly protein PilP